MIINSCYIFKISVENHFFFERNWNSFDLLSEASNSVCRGKSLCNQRAKLENQKVQFMSSTDYFLSVKSSLWQPYATCTNATFFKTQPRIKEQHKTHVTFLSKKKYKSMFSDKLEDYRQPSRIRRALEVSHRGIVKRRSPPFIWLFICTTPLYIAQWFCI